MVEYGILDFVFKFPWTKSGLNFSFRTCVLKLFLDHNYPPTEKTPQTVGTNIGDNIQLRRFSVGAPTRCEASVGVVKVHGAGNKSQHQLYILTYRQGAPRSKSLCDCNGASRPRLVHGLPAPWWACSTTMGSAARLAREITFCDLTDIVSY